MGVGALPCWLCPTVREQRVACSSQCGAEMGPAEEPGRTVGARAAGLRRRLPGQVGCGLTQGLGRGLQVAALGPGD